MKDIALKYHNLGLSVIPVGLDKIPLRGWKKSIDAPVEPNGQFDKAQAIGIVCGAASQGVEVIDVDLKYDISGTLWSRYQDLVGDVIKKTVIEKTPTGGYHVIYRCEVIEGNTKLASRYTTEEERKQNPDQKVKVLLETRGQGGYIMCAPSHGYELIQGDFASIPVLSVDERNALIDSAKALNEVFVEVPKPQIYYSEQSPYNDYNDKGDVVSLLQNNGWEYVTDSGQNMMFKRPGGEHKWSAGLHRTTRLFYVFTSSSQFEPNRAYNPFQVLCILNFNNDYISCREWLKNNGYGVSYKKITDDKPKGTFVATVDKKKQYLEAVRNGTLAMGLSLGLRDLDEHWRLKYNHLRCWNGIDNTGKSQVVLYLMVLAGLKHDWRILVYAGENSVGNVYRKIIEFYKGAELKYLSKEDYEDGLKWADKHFKVIEHVAKYTYKNILEIANQEFENTSYQSLMIDPYNALYRAKKYNENDHNYDYDALGDMRQWITDHNCCIDLICHAGTEAARRIHPKGHKFEGMVMPPSKADTEGGQKFANRVDDFMTIHRYAQSKTDWMWNEIHVRKIKETETGGKITYIDEPIKLKMNFGQCGFVDEWGQDAVTGLQTVGAKDIDKVINRYEKDEEMPY